MQRQMMILGILVLVLAGLGMSPVGVGQERLLFGVLAGLGLVLVVRAVLAAKATPDVVARETVTAEKPPVAPPAPAPAPAPPPPPPQTSPEAAAVLLLGVLQEKGRLLDFLMDDITPYGDAQVGAAARVVHQGCRAALKEHVEVVPVMDAVEGSVVTVPTDGAKEAYRLLGKVGGEPPFSGTLVHKGWEARSVRLPRVLGATDRLPVIAPAQVELK